MCGESLLRGWGGKERHHRWRSKITAKVYTCGSWGPGGQGWEQVPVGQTPEGQAPGAARGWKEEAGPPFSPGRVLGFDS